MFCTNCGAENADSANNCQKCGFKLKEETAAPKFKGTMLMMNAPPELQHLRQGIQAGTPAGPNPSVPSPAVPTPAAAGAPPTGPMPVGAGPTGTAAMPAQSAMPKQSFKGTMLGVAPPSLADLAGAGHAAGSSAAGAVGAPANFSQVPSTAAASPAALAAQVAPPASPVNPLGGTMVAYGVPEAARQHIAAQAAAGAPAAAAAVGALASTIPSGGSPVSQSKFASTTPSAGTVPASLAAMTAQQPAVRIANAPPPLSPVVSSAMPRSGFLIGLIVVLLVALAAMCWSMLRAR